MGSEKLVPTLMALNRVESDRVTAFALAIPADKYDIRRLIETLKKEPTFEGRTLIREILGHLFLDKLTFEILKDLGTVDHDDVRDWAWSLLTSLFLNKLSLPMLMNFVQTENADIRKAVSDLAETIPVALLDYEALLIYLEIDNPHTRELAANLIGKLNRLRGENNSDMEDALRKKYL